jgi:hypothetical protein
MVGLTDDQRDQIYNGLIVGMSPEDCFLFAGLSAETINWIADDDEIQMWIHQTQKLLEYNLLQNMHKGSEIQISNGKTEGTQWLLERLYSRYSQKATPDTGTINLVLKRGEDTSDIETVVGVQEVE